MNSNKFAGILTSTYFAITVILEVSGSLTLINENNCSIVIYSLTALINLVYGPVFVSLMKYNDGIANRSSKLELYCSGAVSFLISIGIHMFSVSLLIASKFGSDYNLIVILLYVSVMMGIVVSLCNLVWLYIAMVNGHLTRQPRNFIGV
jgi:membrane-associated HD superfamily phosphohydrolase